MMHANFAKMLQLVIPYKLQHFSKIQSYTRLFLNIELYFCFVWPENSSNCHLYYPNFREACQSTINPANSPRIELIDLNDDSEVAFNLDVAHLQANFYPNASLNRWYDAKVGRFDFR